MDKVIFGKRLKEVRLKRKMTTEELAEHLGITAKSINHIESGKRLTSLEVFRSICTVLKIDPQYLLYLDDDFKDIDSKYDKLLRKLSKLPPEEVERFKDYIDITIENKKKYKK